MTDFQTWLREHALTTATLEEWRIVYADNHMLIPVFSITGKRAFILKRNFYGEQKYQVDPEGARRGYQLYGLWRSANSIINLGYAVVVEGFSDCLALWPHMNNTVSMLGSKITDVQRNTLKCFCDQLILFSDGDETGENTARTTASDPGMLVTSFIVDGYDPAEFLAAGGDIQDTLRIAQKYSRRYRFTKFDLTGRLLEAEERDPAEVDAYLERTRSS